MRGQGGGGEGQREGRGVDWVVRGRWEEERLSLRDWSRTVRIAIWASFLKGNLVKRRK